MMGIRIHKVIGYGMNDIEDSVNDPRFNKAGYFGTEVYEREDAFTDDGYDAHIKKILDDGAGLHDLTIMAMERTKAQKENKAGDMVYDYKDSIDNCITYDDEYGMASVMVFTPPYWSKNWNRYDDIIDYYDPTHSEADGSPGQGYQLTNRPIYPFESYNDCRTTPPVRLNNEEQSVFIQARNARNDNRSYSQTMTDHAVEKMNFVDEEQMLEMVNPIIPRELVELLKYLKVFNDEADIYRLKPMIYWYWG